MILCTSNDVNRSANYGKIFDDIIFEEIPKQNRYLLNKHIQLTLFEIICEIKKSKSNKIQLPDDTMIKT